MPNIVNYRHFLLFDLARIRGGFKGEKPLSFLYFCLKLPYRIDAERRDKHLKIKFCNGSQVDDKIEWEIVEGSNVFIQVLSANSPPFFLFGLDDFKIFEHDQIIKTRKLVIVNYPFLHRKIMKSYF